MRGFRFKACFFIPAALVLALPCYAASGANKSEGDYYLNPPGTIGYEAEVTFQTPKELENAVNFWKKIYTQYTTKQSVIHDSQFLEVIYTAIDFTSLENNPRFSEGQRRKIREERTEEIKDYYRHILARLDQVDMEEIPLSSLDDEELRVYNLFKNIDEAYRFERSKSRLRSQVGQRDEFIRGIVDSGGYIKEMENIFRSYRLPTQLVRLAFVESMFNPKAFSKASASGLWQFIPSTGRNFLRIDHWIDERNDPVLATHAAARLLLKNYEALEKWPLAITAYNHGRSGMARAVRETGSQYLPNIIDKYRSSSFGFASRNFYVQFLAALEVEKNFDRHFGQLVRMQPVQYEILRLPDHVSLKTISEYCRVPEDELIDLNPALSGAVMNSNAYVPTDYDLRIPKGKKEEFLVGYANIPTEHRHALQQAVAWHRVRRGEVMSKIARRYGITVGHLLNFNGLSGENRLYVGQLLKVPQKPGAMPRQAPLPADYIEVARAPKVRVSYPEVKILTLEETHPEENAKSEAPEVAASESKDSLGGASLAAADAGSEPANASSAEESSAPADSRDSRPLAESATEVQPSFVAQAGNPPANATPIAEPQQDKSDRAAGYSTLFALLDPGQRERDFSLAPLPSETIDAESVVWNFRYDPANKNPAADAPFAGTTIVTDGETAGHFAEWCHISTPHFRRLNRLKFAQGLALGQKVKLQCLVTQGEFHQERLAYHRGIQKDFLKGCPALNFESHKISPNESIWDLANKTYETPIWLIQKYNPQNDLTRKIGEGVLLRIPKCSKTAHL